MDGAGRKRGRAATDNACRLICERTRDIDPVQPDAARVRITLTLSHHVIETATSGEGTVPVGVMITTGGVLSPPPMFGMPLGVGLVGCCAAVGRTGTLRTATHTVSVAAMNDILGQCT